MVDVEWEIGLIVDFGALGGRVAFIFVGLTFGAGLNFGKTFLQAVLP